MQKASFYFLNFLKPGTLKFLLAFILFFPVVYFSPCRFVSGWTNESSWGICHDFGFWIISGKMVYDVFAWIWGVFGYVKWPLNLVPLFAIFIVSYIISCALLTISLRKLN